MSKVISQGCNMMLSLFQKKSTGTPKAVVKVEKEVPAESPKEQDFGKFNTIITLVKPLVFAAIRDRVSSSYLS